MVNMANTIRTRDETLKDYAIFAARRYIPTSNITLDRALSAANSRIADPTTRSAAIEFYRVAAANAIVAADSTEGAQKDKYLDVAARAALRVTYKDKGTDPILLE